ncbi:response regulator receiver domain protein [Candidatus Vecturithrix granuli]|uniref:Response regulator receiver domain protein n=1 Tax=Vecturithrix granuli TaxID=1499967 RepID=A0A081BV27_VECG1|nr:response regulator receiver domain protein [Candidatus Vecturithrix granuli]
MKRNALEKGSVLIVDDHPGDLDVLISALQACGLTILVAPHGEYAINLAEQFTPDIILLDVRMPGLEGFATCRQLRYREITRDIPIIFIIASSETLDKATGFEVGGMDYLTKPFQPQEVVARVTAYLTIQKLRTSPGILISDEKPIGQIRYQPGAQPAPKDLTFHKAIEAYEKHIITAALEQHGDNMAKTAASLGIPLRTLYRKIKKYRLA